MLTFVMAQGSSRCAGVCEALALAIYDLEGTSVCDAKVLGVVDVLVFAISNTVNL